MEGARTVYGGGGVVLRGVESMAKRAVKSLSGKCSSMGTIASIYINIYGAKYIHIRVNSITKELAHYSCVVYTPYA